MVDQRGCRGASERAAVIPASSPQRRRLKPRLLTPNPRRLALAILAWGVPALSALAGPAVQQTPIDAKLLRGAEAFVEEVTVLHEWVGEAAGDQFGWVARTMGDLDEDGVLDFVASAPTHGGSAPRTGKVYAYSSLSGELLWEFEGQPGQTLGNGVGRCLDLDEDGIRDVLVGAPSGAQGGRVYALSGFDGSVILEMSSGLKGDRFGLKLCGTADLNGDEVGEIVVGAPGHGPAGQNDGRVYVLSGADGEILYSLDAEAPGSSFGSAVDAQLEGESPLLVVGAMTFGGTGKASVFRLGAEKAEPAFSIDPDATAANLGQYFVTLLGDVDGDGVGDVYASDWNNRGKGPNCGRVYVHSGKTGERLLSIDGHRPGEGFGTSPSAAGDVDGDGHADLIVGAWQNADGAPSGGKCYLHSGKDGSLMRAYTCKQAGDTFGFDATNVGDADGDGVNDFLLTSGWSPARGAQTGRVFLISGAAPKD